MSPFAAILQLHDVDLLLHEVRDPGCQARLRKLGFPLDGVAVLDRMRSRLMAHLDRRWTSLYHRALGRYGRAVAAVRERVCLGCFVTLPTSAQPGPGDSALTVCESCGRILYWR